MYVCSFVCLKCGYKLKSYSKHGEYLGKCYLSVYVYSVMDMFYLPCLIVSLCKYGQNKTELKRLKVEQDTCNYSA